MRRSFGERTVPRVQSGALKFTHAHARGRVTVIVGLRSEPLAAYNRNLFSATRRAKLDVRSRSSRRYLARLAREQRAAVRILKRAIPSARVSYRYRVVLNGFAVTVPYRKLPTLVRLAPVTKVYATARYQLDTNRSPAVIGADALWAATGDRGEGVKIGVVDDGVDETNPFFDPTGFTYPPGFPKGARKWTTPKVIVARAFPGPGSGRQGRLPIFRPASFHGTHVSGIAAGDANTTAPAGPDHPATSGLSGIAPRAWIGNYRVFNAPTPTGFDAFTPQIVAAFEAAVDDGMDVINFSGGGPQPDPVADALVDAVRNVAAAGVVPVISAGNDRDEWGLGSVGSPGTAPDAISVAAVSNSHVFAPSLSVDTPDAPATVKSVPVTPSQQIASSWAADQTLVDVGTIVGTDGRPVDRHLCGPPGDPNDRGTIPAGSLNGSLALVFRGTCAFTTKAANAQLAGAIGLVIVDNRPQEANTVGLPIRLSLDAVLVTDLDGARLRDFLDTKGGRAPVRFNPSYTEIPTGRSGIVTGFSSAGPTDFDHQLKPDLAAPGGEILSATLPESVGEPFAVFDGTSMAAPHVSGAAALLVARHRNWSPDEVKSALMSTAGPAWGDTARTQEASVLLEGAGLINLPRADDPKIFTNPVSLSFDSLNLNAGPSRRSSLFTVSDAGGGAGTWAASLQPQAATTGASIDVPPLIALPPGGSADVPVVVRAGNGAATGDNYGFITLTRGTAVRRIPYYFSVERPGAEQLPASRLKRLQVGDTFPGKSWISQYRFPTSPFGPPPTYTGPPMNENGKETLYYVHINQPVANVGAAVIAASSGSLPEPWFLGSKNENDVQGYSATPVDANLLTFDYRIDIGAAGVIFPREKRYYVALDSGTNIFTGASLAGRYLLRSWVNDVTPPRLQILTRRVTAGRPMLAARITDRGAGVDPLSLVIQYRARVLLGAALYDPSSGLALFPIPRNAPPLKRGKFRGAAQASDYQEAKNVDQIGPNILPNTTTKRVRLIGVSRPTITWLLPLGRSCLRGRTTLAVAAATPAKVRAVRFFADGRRVATVRRGISGLYAARWSAGSVRAGRHVLRAVLSSAGGKARARRAVRVCR